MKLIERLYKIKYPSGQLKWVSKYLCPYCEKKYTKLETTVNKSTIDHCGCLNDYSTNWKYGKELRMRWYSILSRTINGKFKRDKSYDDGPYKDVKICDEWNNSFKSFYNWSIDNGFEPNLHIDRKDPMKGYEPSNCRWVTQKENNRNGARSKLTKESVREILFLYGVYKNTEISRVYKVTPSIIANIANGTIWNDIYKQYGKIKTKRLVSKFLLDINRDIKPGFIDFNNRRQLEEIEQGYLTLKDYEKYTLIDLTEQFTLYSYYDKSTVNYNHFFKTIEVLAKHPEEYNIFLRRTHCRRLEQLSTIRNFFKIFIKKEIIDNFITHVSGYKILIENKNS